MWLIGRRDLGNNEAKEWKVTEVTDRQTVTEPGSDFQFCFSRMQIWTIVQYLQENKKK